jgi:5'-3' exonuclease
VSKRPALYIVDGHSNIFRAYHAMEYLSTSRGQPTHAILILSTMLWKLIREEQPEYMAIALDPPGPTFRDKLFTDYKATRTAMPSDLARQLPFIRRLFDALRTPVLEVPGYEADDVLATLVEQALKLTDLDVVLVTGDKDLLQLVGPRVRVLSVVGRTGEKIVYDEAKVRERWGVGPDQIPDVMALMGDSIDNVPGVKGVGEKTAVKLIGQYGSVARLYDNLTLIPGKLRETLALGRKNALLSRELVVLNREVPITFDLEAYRRGEPDWPRLRGLWLELEFTRLVKELPPAAPAADHRRARRLPRGRRRRGRGAEPPGDGRGVPAGGVHSRRPSAGGPRRQTADRGVARRAHAARRRRQRRGCLPAQSRARDVQARRGLHGGIRRVPARAIERGGGRPAARARRPCALAASLLGIRAQRSRRARPHPHLRGDRATARAGAGRDGAHRDPRRSRASRGLRQGARARPRQPHARDLRAGG